MGWTEREYYESSPEAVYYAFEGYFDKRKEEESWQRHSTNILFRVLGGKENIERIWPINKDEPKEEIDPRKYWNAERYAQLIKTHNLKVDG